MIKKYTLKLIFVLSIALFLPNILFAQVGIVGYAYGQRYIDNLEFPEYTTTTFPSNLQLNRLTHVITSDIGCRNNGSLFTGKLPNSWEGPTPINNTWNGSKNKWLTSLINRAHAKGVKVSICVGGDTTHFPHATHSANLNTFVNNIVNFVNVHGFDGVNINWEYPRNATEWNQCIALLNSLRNNLSTGKTINIALSHSKHVYSNYTHVPQQILNIVDGIYLMTYDEGHSSWPSHSDVARSIQAINEWVSWQTPTCEEKKKLFLGSAFYGWHPAVGGSGERISYRDYILNNDSLWNTNPGDVPADVQNKAIHTRDNGFGGVFIWELGFDVPANQSNSLLKAIHEVMPYSSGPSFVCNTSTPFTLNNPPPGTISWSKSNNITYVSGQGAEYNVKAASSATSGPGWVQATINGPCGSVQLPRHDVWVGIPSQPQSITGFPYNGYSFPGGVNYNFTVGPSLQQAVSSYQWSVSYGTIQNGSGSNPVTILTHQPPPGVTGYFDLSVRVGNTCGFSPWLSRSGFVKGTGAPGPLALFPNPAKDLVWWEIDTKQIETTDDQKVEIYIYDRTMNLREKISRHGYTGTLNLGHLKPDMYIIIFMTNNEVFEDKIIITQR